MTINMSLSPSFLYTSASSKEMGSVGDVKNTGSGVSRTGCKSQLCH